eukprot:2350996-Pleurochrysis_carterae.AAC.4
MQASAAPSHPTTKLYVKAGFPYMPAYTHILHSLLDRVATLLSAENFWLASNTETAQRRAASITYIKTEYLCRGRVVRLCSVGVKPAIEQLRANSSAIAKTSFKITETLSSEATTVAIDAVQV